MRPRKSSLSLYPSLFLQVHLHLSPIIDIVPWSGVPLRTALKWRTQQSSSSLLFLWTYVVDFVNECKTLE